MGEDICWEIIKHLYIFIYTCMCAVLLYCDIRKEIKKISWNHSMREDCKTLLPYSIIVIM